MAEEWLPYEPVAYDRDLELTADACVIGTGAGGAVFASELAEAGRSVVMLEKGHLYTRKDFNQHERDMMPKLFEEGGARTTSDGGIVVLHGNCVGGSTTVNWAICFDPPEQVLDAWSTGWSIPGIRLADLRPSLDKVRFVLNVRRLEAREVNRNSQLLMEGARKLGMRAERFEHSRTACVGSGFCILGCAYDRKQSMLVTYVPRAIHHGARLLAAAEVTGFERSGDRITAAVGVLTDPASGRQHRVRVKAGLFAVAGGAISTPVLLAKNGLANSSGRLGENLTIHPTTAVVGIFDEPVRGFEGIHFGSYMPDLEPEGIIIEAVFAYPGLLASAMLAAGERSQRLLTQYDHMAAGIVLLHDDGRGRVRVDRHGLPVIDYQVSPKDQAKFRKGLKTLARIYFAAGAREVVIPHVTCPLLTHADQVDRVVDGLDLSPNRLATFSAHQMGTAAMAADPRQGVTDPWGRVHGWRNLLVVDGSLMPTSLGVNPQITIAALADRAARHVLADPAPYFGAAAGPGRA